ncbi:hypothetical protein BC829DRAFT_269072 [Chytridium lagenaria]|nr:hypothetical protein BC829DRAFT_269072 [Chytridium lagenaria]
MDDSPFSLIDERETIDQLIARLTACSADLLNPRVSSASVQTSPDDLRTALIQRLNVTPPARRWGVEEEEMMEISGGPRGDVAMAAEVKVGEEVYVSSEDILKRAFEQEEEYGEVDYGSDDDEDEKEEAEDEDLEEGGDLVEITERQLEATSKEINDSIESILKQVSEIESERARITDPEHLSYYVDYFNKLSSSLEELLSARERIAMYREVIKMRKEQGSYGDLLADSDDETEKVEEKQVETGGETPALAAEAPAPSVAVETTEVNASNAVEKVELKPPTVEKIETPAPIAETPKDASPLLQLKQAWAETEKR